MKEKFSSRLNVNPCCERFNNSPFRLKDLVCFRREITINILISNKFSRVDFEMNNFLVSNMHESRLFDL